MNVYQDITLLPDADIAAGFLWQKLYQQVHIALVEHKVGDNQSTIAISFPEYGQKGFPLGSKLRLFAPEQAQLEKLNIAGYLSRLLDYVHLKSIQPVPSSTTGYASFVRHHAKGHARIEKDEREKAELWARKSGKSLEECLETLAKTRPQADNKLPFIWMESQETKKRDAALDGKFPLFISMIEYKVDRTGKLNCYGLSYPQYPVALPQF
ncbi:type I-F CRISPR-associated endoribonuclease Cas6/Csy4 [Nitrincola iocasae]|uniref:Type I-F CRISPR-associated endoribonuclease Cas6/Csy4 n=1 Tax=Nitrincola iocasae TaxID=2614693 RepID=A0A5J6LCL0_9GAMM|nr:type I-F CRISPR-associated endoribonuclease Cas6/Csy4 [Nitrincola iocasae]QEW06038.1 type I-F CRISPR-associated endoribonuclease Cas6/Csy4 [Nitrincola iocasae]